VIKNNSTKTVVLNWIDFDGILIEYARLGPGNHYRQQTYVNHLWQLAKETGEVLCWFKGVAGTKSLDYTD
jgi:hypothetical protein